MGNTSLLILTDVINSENYEKCWVIRNPNGDIICVVKSDEDRMKYRKKGFYIDEYKLFDK